jgi:two-component system, cell cycle sensor histidine kinase and response regulator CckA
VATGSPDIYRDFLESLDGVVWEADPVTLQFTSVTPNVEALFGYLHSTWTSNPTFWAGIIHPDDRQRTLDIRVQAVARCATHRVDYRVLTADGRTRWIRDTVRVTCERGKPLRLYGVMVDVTVSQELRQREAYYRALVDNSADAIALLDRQGTVRFVERISGVGAGELIGTNTLDRVHPDDLPRVKKAFEDCVQEFGNRMSVAYRARRDDGSWQHRELIGVNRLDDPVIRGIVVNYRDISERGQPDGALVDSSEDVTDRGRLEGQLRHGQKMEAVGRLAGGLAHDFNNLLTVIIGYSELVLQQLVPGTPMHHDLEEIRHAGTSAAALTRQLLAFTRTQILQPQILDLNAIVSRMDARLRRLIGEDVELATRLATPLDLVRVDPWQIEQILLNLALNARDAMPHGGRLTVETAHAHLDAQWVAQHPVASEGPHVMLVISDTGIGMDENVQAHLFEPFFTTKERGKGTGLGLATVYGIVKQSGGSIVVQSEPQRGATFRIFLPRTEPSADLPSATRPTPQSLGGTETILLVQDQPDVRAVTRDTLARHGYTVLAAANGARALSILEHYAGEVHLVLTEVVMPGMSGRDLAKQLITRRPDLRVLYTSGYADDTNALHGALEAGTAFIQKPFTPTVLLQAVRDLLDAR